MEILKNKIEESWFYRWIVMLCVQSQNSFALKAIPFSKVRAKKEVYRFSGYYQGLVGFGKFVDWLFKGIVEAYHKSFLITMMHSAWANFAKNSLLGKILNQFRLAYLVALYVYIDFAVRTLFGATFLASTWDELLFIGLFAYILFKRIFYRKKWVMTSLDLPILAFIAVGAFLLFVNSPEFLIGIDGFRAVYQYVLWFFVVIQLIDSKETARGMVWVSVVGVGLLGLHGVYQYLTGAQMLGNWVDSTETIKTRAYSIVKSPNSLGSLFVLYLPVAFGLFLSEKDTIKKIMALFFTATMGAGLLLTFTRGAWITAFLGVLIVLFFAGKRLIGPIIAIIMALMMNVSALYARISYLFTNEYKAKSSAGGRIYRWQTAISEWSESKWLGLGLGRYGGAIAMKNKLAPFYVDNYYIKTLAEIGIIGLATFVIVLLIVLRQLYLYMIRVKDHSVRLMMVGLYAGILGVVLHNCVENIFENPFMVTYFWMNVAVLISISLRFEEGETNE